MYQIPRHFSSFTKKKCKKFTYLHIDWWLKFCTKLLRRCLPTPKEIIRSKNFYFSFKFRSFAIGVEINSLILLRNLWRNKLCIFIEFRNQSREKQFKNKFKNYDQGFPPSSNCPMYYRNYKLLTGRIILIYFFNYKQYLFCQSLDETL